MSEFDVRFAVIDPSDIRGRLIRNPNYGGPAAGINGWTWRPELSKHGKEGFQAALTDSIAQTGVRNPVLVWSLSEGLFLSFGGSRVRSCLHLGKKEIPAIVNDYTGDFAHGELVTPENVDSFFTDVPRDMEFGEFGFDYHYNLERARRHNYDESGLAWLGDDEPNWLYKEFPWL